MGAGMWLAMPGKDSVEASLGEVNRRLDVGGLSITRVDAQMIAAARADALAETERVEFGTPAVVAIAEAVATSPCLSQAAVAEALAELQGAFNAIRDELPADVPDAEIACALRGCLDEWGDASTVASMSAEEVMRFSEEYTRTVEAEGCREYRIVDDEGRVYAFDPAEWDYDEHADGWDGERWADDWDD